MTWWVGRCHQFFGKIFRDAVEEAASDERFKVVSFGAAVVLDQQLIIDHRSLHYADED